jgi:hypothetical protein
MNISLSALVITDEVINSFPIYKWASASDWLTTDLLEVSRTLITSSLWWQIDGDSCNESLVGRSDTLAANLSRSIVNLPGICRTGIGLVVVHAWPKCRIASAGICLAEITSVQQDGKGLSRDYLSAITKYLTEGNADLISASTRRASDTTEVWNWSATLNRNYFWYDPDWMKCIQSCSWKSIYMTFIMSNLYPAC